MQLNKQDEKLLQELLKKYKQGIISGFYSGNNITFTPTGCRDKIISSTGGGASGGIESIVAGTNITIDDTDPLNPIVSAIGGSSALFPNGVKIIEDTAYELSSADAGYALVAVNANTHFIMPTPCPFSVGDVIGLSGDLDTTTFDNNSITQNVQLYTGEFAEAGEIVILQCVDVGAGADMLPLSAIKDDNGTLKTINKYLYDNGGYNWIPLTGTTSGNPVTGDIEFNTGGGTLKHFNEDLDGYNFLRLSNTSVQLSVNESSQITSLEVGQGVITVHSDDVYNVGLTGDRNFNEGAGYLPNLYAQIAYVGARGTATLSSGTVTVATDKIKTGYKIYVSVDTPSGTQGFLSAQTGSIVDGTEFVIKSTSATDDSTVNWWIAP